MKAKGTRSAFAARLNEDERKQIVKWSRAGVAQEEIARRLRCDARTVRKWQDRLGCHIPQEVRPLDEQAAREIRAFAGSGLGYRAIAKITGIGTVRVRRYMRAHALSQKTGHPFLPKKKRVALENSIRNREDFLYKIARTHGVGLSTVNRLKKRILGPAPLKSTWPPLQSKFPQLDARKYLSPNDIFMEIVEKSIDATAHEFLQQGRNPAEALAAKHALRADPSPIVQRFEAGLREAITTSLLNKKPPQVAWVH